MCNSWHFTSYQDLKKLVVWRSKYIKIAPHHVFVALLKLKADVIKDMFQPDTVHTGPVTWGHCSEDKKGGIKDNLMEFIIIKIFQCMPH